MKRKIRLLGIAPYENMKTMMLKVAEEYPDIELTVFVGDLEQGVEVARRNFYNDYDAIVSRGGTAELLQKSLSLPVVEIEMSLLDIMRAMKLAEKVSDHYAVVGFSGITANAKHLSQLMQYNLDIYTIQSENQVEQTLREIQKQGTRAILCDMVTNTTAQRLGLDVILIASGAESIRSALEDAIRLCRNYRSLRQENQFLRDVIWNQMNQTVVFDREGQILFSTLENNSIPIVDYMRQECREVALGSTQHLLKRMNHVQYSIRVNRRALGEMEYVAFYFSESRAPAADQQRGIRYVNCSEALEEYNASLYGLTGLIRELQEHIAQMNLSGQPVMIWGEDGTCKEQVVNYLYTKSSQRERPLVIIECFQLNEKTWSYLLDSHNSPLMQSNYTIFLKNVDALTPQQRRELLSNLLAMDICKRNRLVISCACRNTKTLTEGGMEFVEKLGCVPIYLPPMRSRASQLPAIANMYLSYLNTTLAKQIVGMEPQAMELLQQFDWPHNYTQFQRILKELAMMIDAPFITEQEVSQVLTREKAAVPVDVHADSRQLPLDLSQTLDKINREIIRRVLEEEHGNQSGTARRLGISRTTLWRLLNSSS